MTAIAGLRSFVSISLILLGLTVVSFERGRAAGVGYTTDADADTALTSITIEHAGQKRIYKPERLIGAEIVHFRSSGGVNLACGSAGDELPASARRHLLDLRLTSGVPNPGAATQPPSGAPALSGDNPTPGLAVKFRQPVVNRPGPDVLVFELQKGSGADAFHVAPLEFEPGLHALTVREYDVPAHDAKALEVGPVTL